LQVIKDNQIITDDWELASDLDNDSPLPEGKVIIPFTYWLDNRESLIKTGRKFAVCVNGDDETEEIARDVEHFEMIALEFPKFTDGRSYTHARLLRERYNYQGELRAVGDVLQDQLFFMKRCGIDSYKLREDKDIHKALQALKGFSVKYQTAADGAAPIYKIRSGA